MSIRYAHTNIISENWKKLARFYQDVFHCIPVPPQRSQSGQWLEDATGVKDAALEGIHLRLPGYGDNGPTLEIFTYNETLENFVSAANRKGFGHIAFEVDNVQEVLNQVSSFGGKAIGTITSRDVPGVGVITVVYAADPDGNIIELQHWEK